MGAPFLLFDGMYLIFSAFYTHRQMRTLKGEPTGAVYGFVTSVESLLKEMAPARVAVALDSPGPTFRHRLYPRYKEKREAAPEELVAQIPLVKTYLEYRGIPMLERPGFEADDIIAAFCHQKSDSDETLILVSADKDLFQLVNRDICLYHPRLKRILDSEAIHSHFGVPPERIVDYLAMVGDTSDNIPGVPGIGDKSARALLDKYHDLESILDHLDELTPSQRNRFIENRHLLDLSRKLVDLSRIPEMEPPEPPPPFQGGNEQQLVEFFARLSFSSLLKNRQSDQTGDELSIPVQVITLEKDLVDLTERIRTAGAVALDVETTALEFTQAELVGISFALDNTGYYVPFKAPAGNTCDLDTFRRLMGDILADPDIGKTGHNLKFDILHLRHHGMDVKGIADDTMVMSYLLYPNRRSHKLKELSAEFLNFRQTTWDELVGTGRSQVSIALIPIERVAAYCVADSHLSLRLAAKLRQKLQSMHLDKLYRDLEIPLINALVDMESRGVRIDRDFIHQAAEKMEKRIDALAEEIFDLAKVRINLNSPQQLGELLFEKMNLPVVKRTRKTRSYSTDSDVLTELRGYPVVDRVLEYRTLQKLHSTYLRGLLDHLDSLDRIHSSFNQTVTATGRLSSSAPNLQNIPVGEMGGVNVRRAFSGDQGTRLMSADYSQVELRVMAHFSEDPELVKAFRSGTDIHAHTAERVFSRRLDLDAAERRRRAKIINFSVLYGSGAYSLSKELGVSFSEARHFIDEYFDHFAGVRKFIDNILEKTREELRVYTLMGRMRPIPEIASANRNVRENGQRMAVNTMIQGSAADIIKQAMVGLQTRLEKFSAHMVMQVHDELVFEYMPDAENALAELVKREMEKAAKLRVPLEVTIKTGPNWGDLIPLRY
ncbi:MAG: DNA polymerase I [Candidatus Aminicenantes bacterium]|nr:DNA polymerase I [Candidatus Aminicenantes bacterium]